MGYNQHQSFYLRDRWLGKGLRAISADERFFFKNDAFERVGLGKNMVQSLRHWVQATGTAVENGIGKKRYHHVSKLGDWVLKNDPSLQYYNTTAILHYMLTYQDEPSSTWFWFFNVFQESTTTRDDMFTELRDWIQNRETRVVAESSIKRDIDCLIRMYTIGMDQEDPEEVTSSPFSKLGLLKEDKGVIYKTHPTVPRDAHLFVMYSIFAYCKEHNTYEISLDNIINHYGLLGKTYNLNRSSIISMLTDMIQKHQYPLTFTRTNNLDVVVIKERLDPNVFLLNFADERL